MKQFVLPVLQQPSSPIPGDPISSALAVLFDMMKLAIPSLILWLTGFYAIFHCYLNILAEVLRFADRYFYSSWWNATSIDAFWRKWNVPVHEWCLRHVYLDLQSSGVSKNVAVFATFFISAVFHELIFSVSFKTFRPWFFLGMLMQIPLIILGKNFTSKRRGNYLMWWSLFSGQPLLELLYFREFFKTNDNFFCNT
jgi:diacylglycerol O-acyltransferase-1